MVNQFKHLLNAHFGMGRVPADLNKLLEDVNAAMETDQAEISKLKLQIRQQQEKTISLEQQLLKETSEVKAAHDELSEFFTQVHEGFFTRDIIADAYTNMSIGCEKIYGYSIEEFFSNSRLWFEVVHPEDRQVLETESAVLMNGETVESIYRIIHKDGSIRWVEVKAVPTLVDNVLSRVDGVVNDITERKKAELALLSNERQLDLIYNTVTESIFMMSVEPGERFRFVSINQAFTKTTGATIDQIIGKDLEDILPEAYREHTLEKYRTAIRTGKAMTWEEYWHNQITGSVTGIVTITPVIDQHGNCSEIIGSMQDISERVKVEQNYEASQQNFQSLVNTIEGIVWESDAVSFEFVFVSRQAEVILGYPVENWIEDHMFWRDHLHPEDRDATVERFMTNTRQRRSHKLEYRMIAADGREVWFQDNVTVVSHEDGSGYVRGIMVEITDRKRTEKIVQDSQERIELIMSAALDAIICMDPDDKITFWNPQAENIFGWKSEEVKGKSLSALIIPERFRERHKQGLKNYLKTGEGPALNVLLELNAIRRTGEDFPVELTVLPIRQAGEEFFCAFIRDITERKKAVKQITDSERRYRLLFEQNLAGVYQTTLSGDILNCNQAFANMLGYRYPADLLFSNITDHELPNNNVGTYLEELQEQGRLYNHEVILKTTEGREVHVLKNISRFEDPVSGVEVFYGIMIDITERKMAEALLSESETRYRQIVETAQEGIWMMDEKFDTIFVNKKMCDLLGYSNEAMLGSSLKSFIAPNDLALSYPLVQKSRNGESYNLDLPLQTSTGSRIWVTLSASPIFDPEDKFTGALAMVTDISKRKMDEEQIKRSEADLDIRNKELKRKNTELEQFAYVASHDLQEPLRTTSSFVQLLKQQYQGKLDERADKYLRFIHESSDRMKVLIKDLLDYSRIGTKNELELVDCNAIIKNVIADLHSAITESGTIITISELPLINGYSTEIKQLFQNLLINAIKFRRTDVQSEVQVAARREEDQWIFSFRDNGIGIDKAHNDRIFIIFQRLHTRTEYQGSGIGLSHCKKIVELHHGKIWVESTPGKGSTFYFSIPFKDSLPD